MFWRSKFEKQVLPHSYKLVTNRSELIVSWTNTRPVQFDLCTLPCADTFIDKRGSGWNKNNKAEYFSVTSTDRGGTQSIKTNIWPHHFSMRRITSRYGQFETSESLMWKTRSNFIFDVRWKPIKLGTRVFVHDIVPCFGKIPLLFLQFGSTHLCPIHNSITYGHAWEVSLTLSLCITYYASV